MCLPRRKLNELVKGSVGRLQTQWKTSGKFPFFGLHTLGMGNTDAVEKHFLDALLLERIEGYCLFFASFRLLLTKKNLMVWHKETFS